MSPRKFTSLINLFLRSSTLVLRFAVTFFVVHYLGFAAAGVYGLAVGAIGIVPAMIGWGLNYYVAREVVGTEPSFAVTRVKSRLFVTMTSLSVATALGLGIALSAGFEMTLLYALIVALIWLETVALDLHIPMIGLEMALEANVLVFIRSASWVPAVLVLGWFFPAFRNLETIFGAWAASHFIAMGALGFFIRRWPLKESLRKPFEFAWMGQRLRRSWLVYMSDLGIVGLIYADRYIVGALLGLELTGVYTFFWSLTNALQTLVTTAVVQLALPTLFKAYRSGSYDRWRVAMREQFIKTASLSVGLSIMIFSGSFFLSRFSNYQFANYQALFGLLLAAAVVRSCSDLFNVGLTSITRDKHYVTINIAGVILSLSMTFAFVYALGLIGSGIASLSSALVLASIRFRYLKHFVNIDPNLSAMSSPNAKDV